jgi:S-adenosyl-L-methionine hydrolase (adenosine-forming)
MRYPILTLTTDFGRCDHYAGVLHGVILGICPQARIVDLTHDVTPYEIPEAAYTISQAYRHFPKKTVHVIVVDPGVGTSRRPILAEAAGQYFIAPDNGVLSMIYAREKHRVRLISNEKLFLDPVSHTFHGRDIFSPVAAHIAAGLAPSRAGKLIDDFLALDFHKPLRTGKRSWQGRILKIDRFGNIVTNFHRDDFPDLAQRNCAMTIGPHHIGVMAANYAQTAPGELFLIFGSGGYVEVSASEASAAKIIGCEVGAPAELMVW